VWPHTGGEAARQLARDICAMLAGNLNSHEGLTLSPVSLLDVNADTRRVLLPSPNGSSIASQPSRRGPFGGRLSAQRRCRQPLPRRVRPDRVGAGRRALGDGWLRPAYEDLVGGAT